MHHLVWGARATLSLVVVFVAQDMAAIQKLCNCHQLLLPTWHAHGTTVHGSMAQGRTLAYLAHNVNHLLAVLIMDLQSHQPKQKEEQDKLQ
jgi:hypothetical protein